ncbi:hypothetical protein KZ810_07675 [Sphingomonas sp. RHCKR47]|uniref:hypothetical protein n=1 Tax=Sphingomonas citricola TaxID=2862498 RepID=UPI001CA505D0|nr:hypothetical protein [Sphingomonas citricola]MBW6523376.1 hypothetical protein [Sphingomonas citricola]
MTTMPDANDRNDLAPMTSADTQTPSGDASFRAAAPLKIASTDSVAAGASSTVDKVAQKGGEAADTIKQGAAGLRDQATDRVRLFAEDGKSKATDALGQLTQILNDAAAQVDDKLGKQYGQYARTAADQVQSFGAKLDDTTVDEIFDEARELVKKSPGVAVGIAAAFGFAIARLVSAGVDQRGA